MPQPPMIGVAVAAFYPSVTLSGSVGLAGAAALAACSTSTRGTMRPGPGITIPIFQGGQLNATLHLRKAQQEEAAVNYQKTVLQAWHDVDNALTAYQTEQARRDQLVLAVAQNQRALALAQSRYQQGVADFLTVLDAERSLLSTQQQLARQHDDGVGESGGAVQGAGRRMGDRPAAQDDGDDGSEVTVRDIPHDWL